MNNRPKQVSENVKFTFGNFAFSLFFNFLIFFSPIRWLMSHDEASVICQSVYSIGHSLIALNDDDVMGLH